MDSENLIDLLSERTNGFRAVAEKLSHYDLPQLNWRPSPNSWTILECLEHLNLYGEFYLPQIEQKINTSKTKSELHFKPGLLGNYFAQSILPKKNAKKIKTFKVNNPIHQKIDKSTIEKFITQQNQLLTILQDSREVSLNKVKITTSISSLISLKLGDTFLFLTNHIERHLNQIDKLELEFKNNEHLFSEQQK